MYKKILMAVVKVVFFVFFIPFEPIGFAGGINLHVYAPNPVGWIDPVELDVKVRASRSERLTPFPQ